MTNNNHNEIFISTPLGSIDKENSVINLEQIHEDAMFIHRNRRLSKKKMRRGERKVLAILVQDIFGNAPHQSEERMARDLFGIGEPIGSNNLVCACSSINKMFFKDCHLTFVILLNLLELNQRERYMSCSNGQLSFVPTHGKHIRDGIMTVTLNWNIKGMSYLDVSNKAMDQLQQEDIERDHTMFIMPDSVNFGDGAAYGETFGQISWFMSFVASYPIIQVRQFSYVRSETTLMKKEMILTSLFAFLNLYSKVHEMGHNLGHSHSGSVSNPYGDSACMMGLAGDISLDSNRCFNPAKTWYNDWFREHHGIVSPLQQGYDGNLVGLDDTANNRISHNQHAVVKVDSTDANGQNSYDLFLMFNRKKGILKDVPSNIDERVIITEQASDGSESIQVASLASGESYVQRNWHKGKSLVVKNCALGQKGAALSSRVLIYYKGAGELYCNDVQLRNRGLSNKCITEKNGSLKVSSCNNLFSQRWHIDNDGRIHNTATNRCIVGKNGATSAGTKVVLGPCKDGKKYQFIMSSGKIKPKRNKKVCIGKSKQSNRLELMPCARLYTQWDEDKMF